jgi:hypothetical protein
MYALFLNTIPCEFDNLPEAEKKSQKNLSFSLVLKPLYTALLKFTTAFEPKPKNVFLHIFNRK